MIAARSDTVRAVLHRNLECLVHESRQIGSGQTGDGKGEHRHSRNQRTKWTGTGEFTQITIISTTVGRNPLEEME